MSGYPAELPETVFYPLPILLPLWIYLRMEKPQPRHTVSFVSLLLTMSIQGLSILAGYRPGAALAVYAGLTSAACLLIPPWKNDVKNGLVLRAVDAVLSAFYAVGMAQVWGLD